MKINSLFGYILPVFVFLLSIGNYKSKNDSLNQNYFQRNNYQNYQLRINEPPTYKNKTIAFKVDVLTRNDTSVIGKSLVYIQKSKLSKQLNYGDVIICNTKFNPIIANKNPLEFNYANYLKLFNIHHQAFITSDNWKKIGEKPNQLFKLTYSISSYLSNIINTSKLTYNNKAIAKALLIGEKEDLDKDILRTYSSAGAMHVLAVSGLHVGIVMLVLIFILKPIKQLKYGHKIYITLILSGVWSYAFITGLSPSVLRSALMFSFIIIGKELQRETSIYQSILISAFILSIINPLVIFKVGFQLSYLAVLGIVYLQPKIYNLIYVKYKILNYIWQISSVSIAAQIATFPIGLYYFHQFPNFFLISNLVVIPLAFIIILLGIFYFLFHWVPVISYCIEFLLNTALTIMNKSVTWVEKLPFSITWGISITWIDTLLIYLSLLFFIFALSLKRIKHLFIGSIILVSFLTIQIFKSHHINTTNELIIYNIKDELAIDIFEGRNNLFLATDSLAKDKSKLLFNIQHYWYYKRGDEKPYKRININKLPSKIINLNGFSLSILDNKINTNNYITDIVVIGNINFINQDYLKLLNENNSKLIIHPLCRNNIKKIIKNTYNTSLTWDIKQQGAFIFSF